MQNFSFPLTLKAREMDALACIEQFLVQNADHRIVSDLEEAEVPLFEAIAQLRTLPSRAPHHNPYIIVSVEYFNGRGPAEELYLTRLRDYALGMSDKSCIEALRQSNEEMQRYIVTAITPRWATRHEMDYMPRDQSIFVFNKGNSEKRVSPLVDRSLKHLWRQWSRVWNPEKDSFPDLKPFYDLYDEHILTLPMRGVIDIDDKHALEFDDLRLAALCMVSQATLPEHDGIDFSKKTRIKVHVENVALGEACLWMPDAREWAQLEAECPPRASWEDMLRHANALKTQKRLKRSDEGNFILE